VQPSDDPPKMQDDLTAPATVRPRFAARAVEQFAAVFLWRGPDGAGAPLRTWLLVTAGAWILARLLAAREPFFTLLPPVLLVAIFLPIIQTVLARCHAAPSGQRVLEVLVVMGALGVLTSDVVGHVWTRGIVIDTADHQIMTSRAQAFADGLRRGHWLHWTHAYQGGDSLTDLYPIFANLLTAAVHAIMPRGTEFARTYTLIVLAAWWLRGAAVYHLARRFSGVPIALLLAVASMFEVGKDVWDGVWEGAFFWGMIHNNIALSFGLFAMAFQVDLTERTTTRAFLGCVLAIAVTAFAHPLGVVFVVVSTAALALAVLIGRGDRLAGTWAAVASVLGILIACVWIVPFTHALRTLGFNNSIPGGDYGQLGRGLLDGTMPTTSFTTFVGFALIAVTAAVSRRELKLLSPALCALLLWLLTLTPLMVSARVFDYFPSFLDGQQRRMLTVLKTAVIPSLAWLLSLAFARLARVGSLAPHAVLGRAILAGLLLLGPARALLEGFDSLRLQLQSQLPRQRGPRPHTGADHEHAFQWLANQRTQDPSPTPWRAAIVWSNRGRHGAWDEGFRMGVPVVDYVNVPANFLTMRPREITAAGFHDWNIRYAILDHAGPPFPGAVLRVTFGQLTIWEVPDYDDRYVVAPPGVAVRDLKFEDDTIRFSLEGVPAGGAEVMIRCAWFPRWRARQGSTSVPLSASPPRPDAKPNQDQLLVHAAKNGEVVVTCDGPMPRFWAGLLFTLFGAAGLVLCASAGGRSSAERRARLLWGRVHGWWSRWLTPLFVPGWRAPRLAIVMAVLGIGMVVAWRGSTRLAVPPFEGIGMDVFVTSVPGGPLRCTGAWWLGRYFCPHDLATVDGWVGYIGPRDDTGEFHRQWPGTRVSIPVAGTTVELRFGRVNLVVGRIEIDINTSGEQQITPIVAGRALATKRAYYEDTLTFDVPPELRGVRELSLRVDESSNGGIFVFRGRTR
jgi:hypothetical protein